MKQMFGILFLLMLLSTGSWAQSLDDLRKKKESAAEQIRYTNELLYKVDENQKVTLNKLRLLNNHIEQRTQLISAMSSEVSMLQSFITDNALVVNMITSDLKKIKAEYAQIIQFAYKTRNAYDKILFFLSAEDFNQAYRRFVYVKQYSELRRRQTEVIASMQNILSKKINKLEAQTEERKQLISEKELESKKLEKEKRQQNTVAKELDSQKRNLRNQLAQQRRVEQQLEAEIQRIIEEEARKSATTGKKGFDLTPEQKLVGDNFEQNKRRIPWPVERGIITEKFGVHPHPVLNNVTVNNNGVNISTESGSKARVVFKGEVSRVFGITGGNMAIIVRHGQYLTVYSNLINVTVKKGDLLKVSQNLGTVFTDSNDGNKTILKFQIWKESTKLDPEDWLSR